MSPKLSSKSSLFAISSVPMKGSKTSTDMIDTAKTMKTICHSIKDNRAINNSIKNLILIKPNEVPFQRDIGSTVSDLLFEFCDEITAELLQIEIKRTIEFNEPRVELEQVEVIPYPDQNHFEVTVKYKIIGYEQVFTVQEILRPTR